MIEVYALAIAIVLGNLALAWSLTHRELSKVSRAHPKPEDAAEGSLEQVLPRIRALEAEMDRLYEQLVKWNKKRGPDGADVAAPPPAAPLSRHDQEREVLRRAGVIR